MSGSTRIGSATGRAIGLLASNETPRHSAALAAIQALSPRRRHPGRAKLAKDVPNLDLHDADGIVSVDTITMSFLVTGIDANGQRQYVARQIVLQGEEVQMPEQEPQRKRGAVPR